MDAFAPASAAHRLMPILENIAIARDTYRLRLEDAAVARAIKPGQFVMIRPGPEGATDPLMGRPLALYEVVRDPTCTPTGFDVVYLVVGRGTAALSQRRPGEHLAVWGPLGNGFGPPPAGPVILVAGGIGQTPFLALGRWWLGQADYGDEPRWRGEMPMSQIHESKVRMPLLPAHRASKRVHSRLRSPCFMACAPPRFWLVSTTSVVPASKSS